MPRNRVTTLIALMIAGAASSILLAAPISLTNPSFEDDVLGNDGTQGTATGWTISGGGIWNPNSNNTQYSPHDPLPGTADGAQTTYLNSAAGTVTQDTGETLAEDDQFTLTVAVGARLDIAFGGADLELRSSGGTSLAMKTCSGAEAPVASSGTFVDCSLTYTILGTDPLTDTLVIRLHNGGGGIQTNFDNVRLDRVMVPVELQTFHIE